MSQFPIAHSLLELRLDLPVWLCSSFAFGQDIAVQTVQLGNPALQAAYAVWPVELAGGFVPNIVYGVYLLRKNDTWKLFKVQQRDFVYATPMGVLWMGAWHSAERSSPQLQTSTRVWSRQSCMRHGTARRGQSLRTIEGLVSR